MVSSFTPRPELADAAAAGAVRTEPCECGAEHDCLPIWHEVLAEEQLDPAMHQWHNPLVCSYVLQHASMFERKFADGQLQYLQLFVEKGIDAVNAVARNLRAHNKGSGKDLHSAELAAYAGIGDAEVPATFALSLHDLRSPDWDFVGDGYEAYGRRMAGVAQATIDAWLGGINGS